MKHTFGTDGLRGVVGQEITVTIAFHLGKAIVSFFKEKYNYEQLKVLIGRDTRNSGNILEDALVSGLCTEGAEALILGVAPTPAVAFLAKQQAIDIGIMITASHNSYEYNGFKIFDNMGKKLSDEEEEAIETILNRSINGAGNSEEDVKGCKTEWPEGIAVYTNYLQKTFQLNLAGIKIVMDCGNGAAYFIAPELFRNLGADVIVINNNPNGVNINLDSGALYPEKLRAMVIKEKASLGIAFDGDADRLIAINECGDILNGDTLIGIFTKYFKSHGMLNKSTVVLTPISNMGLIQTIKHEACLIVEVNVGDRFIINEMVERELNLGGERSGHIIMLDYNTTSDGLLSALMLLRIMMECNQKLSDLSAQILEFPQLMINAKVNNDKKSQFNNYPEINAQILKIENMIQDKGRFLIRISGTEPVIRILIEGENIAEAINEVRNLENLLQQKLA